MLDLLHTIPPVRGGKVTPSKKIPEEAFEDFRPIARRWVLDRLEEFLAMNPKWSETSLLNAAKMDHRFFARIRDGESFTTQKVYQVFDVANKIMRGEIPLEQGRTIRSRKTAAKPPARKNPKK